MKENIIEYYNKRAIEYDRIYQKPERLNDLLRVKKHLQELFADKAVVEVACGTGFWTKVIAATAKKVSASDINESVLDIAQQAVYPKGNVNFTKSDIESLGFHEDHDAVFGGFIWSHIKKGDLDEFMEKINLIVPKGSVIAFLDNRFIEESSTPIAFTDDEGNTYQKRMVQQEEFHILKNFPSTQFLKDIASNHGEEVNIIETDFYWLMTYKNT